MSKVQQARLHLEEAIKASEVAQATWSECFTSLHLAEINLKKAQRAMREAFNILSDALEDPAS
jgi:exonuclease VII small subunit